ncbi:MAG TPA: hypothetical protein VI793_06095 [Anaerolineales bacterium]|nr:hypothetical protein [Anaerolineales bacterium]
MKLQHLSKWLVVLTGLLIFAFATKSVEAADKTDGKQFQIFLPLVAAGGAPVSEAKTPAYETFAASVADGQAGVVRGVYAADVLALRVEQQPADSPNYIDSDPEAATQFQTASFFGVTGLLAHNDLAGEKFFDLAEGQEVRIVYGDGATKRYSVTRIYRFQALDPYSPTTSFVDLGTGATLTTLDVFSMVYMGEDHVTFQTCIEENGNPSWGRLFVIATLLN